MQFTYLVRYRDDLNCGESVIRLVRKSSVDDSLNVGDIFAADHRDKVTGTFVGPFIQSNPRSPTPASGVDIPVCYLHLISSAVR